MNESLENSNIEGIGNLARQFSIACMDLKRNPYIMLASNTAKFDTEFAKFMEQIGRIEVRLIRSSRVVNLIPPTVTDFVSM